MCDSVHRGVSASVHAGIPPPRSIQPQEQTPPLGADPPKSRHSPKSRHPQGAETPPMQTPLRCRACWEIRSTRERYASYWNAILLWLFPHHIIITWSRLIDQPAVHVTLQSHVIDERYYKTMWNPSVWRDHRVIMDHPPPQCNTCHTFIVILVVGYVHSGRKRYPCKVHSRIQGDLVCPTPSLGPISFILMQVSADMLSNNKFCPNYLKSIKFVTGKKLPHHPRPTKDGGEKMFAKRRPCGFHFSWSLLPSLWIRWSELCRHFAL